MKPKLIQGGNFKDDRGQIDFVNDFDLSPVKRMYFTTNADTETIRAWQGHKIESRWFTCVKGSFEVKLVCVDNWETPSKKRETFEYKLSANNPQVLYIPNGFLNGFQALEEDSKLMILSNYGLDENPNDNYRFDLKQYKW